jgi:mono/diheme cytochrome c family protein
MTRWTAVGAILATLALGCGALAQDYRTENRQAIERTAPTFNAAQTQFMIRCGGCHGTLGSSPPTSVPNLRGTAGYFLCTPEGREYIVRLPNVAGAQLTDEKLAAMLNFVAFELGEGSAPKDAKPYTAEEVGPLRKQQLNTVPLAKLRSDIVRKLVRRCGAPSSMLDYKRQP